MENCVLLPGEQERIDSALKALESDSHAPTELSVKVRIHIHREYPKVVGDKLVNSKKEEAALKPKPTVVAPKPPVAVI